MESTHLSDIIKKIEQILENKVRPILLKDEGNIRVETLTENGTLVLIYSGRCSGCPAIDWTHEKIVVPSLISEIKEIKVIEKKNEYGF